MKLIPTTLIAASLFLIGGATFKSTAPKKCSTILKTDTMFVLTGEGSRIPFAVRKLNQYPDTRLYIIGAGGHMDYDNDRIRIESKSTTTYENALAIKKISNKLGLYRIVLITSEDHYNRAQYLISEQVPDVEIVSCPVPLKGLPVDKRLKRWGLEYAKYIGTMFGFKEG